MSINESKAQFLGNDSGGRDINDGLPTPRHEAETIAGIANQLAELRRENNALRRVAEAAGEFVERHSIIAKRYTALKRAVEHAKWEGVL